MKIKRLSDIDFWKHMEEHIVGREMERESSGYVNKYRFANEEDADAFNEAWSSDYSNDIGFVFAELNGFVVEEEVN